MNFTSIFRTCLTVIFVTVVQSVSFLRKQDWNVSLQVTTKYGILQGHEGWTYNSYRYFLFEGIPFARPPVGYLRFRSPRPTLKWKGVLDATEEGSNCVELRIRNTGISFSGTEDCLYMNIYSPVSPSNINRMYPVYVYIYGGGFADGRASKELYGPDYLLAQDIIVVTFNYRLNVFGFLSTEDEASPGNYGLKDQNLALRWVKDNIRPFGGDPERITIGGQSAGAVSVMYHVVSPKSRGLFNGAIAISGDSLALWGLQRVPGRIAKDFSVYFGMESANSTAFVEHLRTLSTDQLKRATASVFLADGLLILDDGLPFTPTIEKPSEEAFITELSYQSLKDGRFAKVPIMIGFTDKEMNFFIKALQLAQPLLLLHDLSPSMIASSLNIKSQAQRRIVGQQIKRKYFKEKSILESSSEELVDYFTDLMYIRPITQTVKLASKYTPVYLYLYKKELPFIKDFARRWGYPIDPSLKGVGHTLDLTCMWRCRYLNFNFTSDMKEFCDRIMKIWSNFMEYGKPTPAPDPLLLYPEWPPVTDPNNITYFIIDENMSLGQNYRKEYLDFWDKMYNTYSKEPYYTY